ncbi:MAG: hypothetical protein M1838_005785 [Thelocarpon superellum]|nr:MAG: hypothetical protein M1838_005785 [Thelocarpon superellum]
MAAQAAAGRRETLTPEEEIKLREFWLAVLDVFGILQHPESETNGSTLQPVTTEEPPGGTVRADTAGSEKKKRRFGIFSRKKNDKEDTVDEAPAAKAAMEAVPTSPATVISSSPATRDRYDQIKDFKKALASQSSESLRASFWSMVKHDHPDSLLLRFLRARKWDIDEALVMLVAAMHWRSTEMHVDDDVIKNGDAAAVEQCKSTDAAEKKEGEDFLTHLRLGKSYLHGTDKAGRPMCIVRVHLHEKGAQTETSLERFTVHTIETARFLLDPPVDTACLIFDMTGFSMANMDYGPVRFMIKCFEANYPESLGVVVVHKSPWVFQGIWTIIKGWLDPVVASKVHFTKNIDELEEYVARDHLPKELGGDEDWTYQYVEPAPGENGAMSNDEARQRLWTEREKTFGDFEQLTIKWASTTQTEPEKTASKGERDQLAAQLRQNYWQVDPFVRARTVYDRTGIIKPGGVLDFYPAAKSSAVPLEPSKADEVD